MKSLMGILGAVLLTAGLYGQATMTMTYQAEIRDGQDYALSAVPVSMRVSVLQGSEDGTPIYIETHAYQTDAFGLVTFDLGTGTPVSGRISDLNGAARKYLDDASGEYYLKTEIDPRGGSNFAKLVAITPLWKDPADLGATRYVGERYGGGIVFHVSDDGRHGLISAVVEESARKRRQHRIHVDTIDFRGGVGAGKIITEPVTREENSEAGGVRVYPIPPENSLSEWYLPTRYDLDLLYLNRAVIGGYASFARGWKRTDVSSINAWFGSFVTGAKFTNGKDNYLYARVLREF